MEQKYDVIVPMTKDNLSVFQINIEYMRKNLSCKRILVIGAEALEAPCRNLGVEYICEDAVFSGMTLTNIKSYLEKRIGNSKRAGWYFQQFLKLAYSFLCKDEYYIVWDADTVPLQKIFHIIDGHPVFTKKEEMEPAYFETLNTLFGGKVERYGEFSFICENMIMNVEFMKEMLASIMKQPGLQGDSFWERILNAVSDVNLPNSGFSEFETYGNYVMTYYPQTYSFRTLQGIRNGAEFFGMSPTKKQLEWAAKSYETIAFERWSYHHKFIGKICSLPPVMAFIPLEKLVNGKKRISVIHERKK